MLTKRAWTFPDVRILWDYYQFIWCYNCVYRRHGVRSMSQGHSSTGDHMPHGRHAEATPLKVIRNWRLIIVINGIKYPINSHKCTTMYRCRFMKAYLNGSFTHVECVPANGKIERYSLPFWWRKAANCVNIWGINDSCCTFRDVVHLWSFVVADQPPRISTSASCRKS